MFQSQYCSQLPIKHCYPNLPFHIYCALLSFCPPPLALLVSPQPKYCSTLSFFSLHFPRGQMVLISDKPLVPKCYPNQTNLLIHPHWTHGICSQHSCKKMQQNQRTKASHRLSVTFEVAFWQILLLTNITISTRQSLCCTETSGTVSLIPRMVSGKMRRKADEKNW